MFLKNSFLIFMVFLLYSKEIATAESPENCSLIKPTTFKLSTFDLGDRQYKSHLYLNVASIKYITVGEFLDYLENVQKIKLSSHFASVEIFNPNIDSSVFTTIPLTTPMCQAIKVLNDGSDVDQDYIFYVGVDGASQQALIKKILKGVVIDDRTGLFKLGKLSPVIINKTVIPTLLNKKTEFLISEDNIDLDPTFIEELYNIVENYEITKIIRTERVIKLLNLYGWYVPNNFVLGDQLNVVKPVNELNNLNENAMPTNLETKVRLVHPVYSKSLGGFTQQKLSTVNANSHFTTTEDQATVKPAFMENVTEEENGENIELKNIIPTCKFLLKNHSNLFAVIRRLIISVGHRQRIRKLQPHINMLQYVNDIWSEYVHSF